MISTFASSTQTLFGVTNAIYSDALLAGYAAAQLSDTAAVIDLPIVVAAFHSVDPDRAAVFMAHLNQSGGQRRIGHLISATPQMVWSEVLAKVPAATQNWKYRTQTEAMLQAHRDGDDLKCGRIAMRMFNEFRLGLALEALQKKLTLNEISQRAKDFMEGPGTIWGKLYQSHPPLKDTGLDTLFREAVDKQWLALRVLSHEPFKKMDWLVGVLLEPANEFAQKCFAADPDAHDIEAQRAILKIIFPPLYTGEPADQVEAAKVVLEHWPQIKKMTEAKDRMAFAILATEIAENEFKNVTEGIISGRIALNTELGERLLAFRNGIGEMVIKSIYSLHHENTPGWDDNAQAGRLLHDGADRIFVAMNIAIDGLLSDTGKIDIEALKYLAETNLHFNSLLRIFKNASLNNILAAQAKGIRVEIDCPEEIAIEDEKKREKIETTLTELVHNAVKYCDPTKTEKSIRIRWDAQNSALVVEDNGLGIENIAGVFEGDREHPEIEGTGRGLGFIRQRLTDIGWTMTVESTVGVGTTITLSPPETSLS
ncbi:MAG: sensor histidine kinase [Deltaproteobacteria bacterium]|nr:sensor histidine kinase [Deltaproteobacteria bacterium]